MLQPWTLGSLNEFASRWRYVENMLLAAAAEGISGVTGIPIENKPRHIKKCDIFGLSDYIIPIWQTLALQNWQTRIQRGDFNMAKAEWYEGKEGNAEHLVYLNSKAKELEKLLSREKTMLIRGAARKKISVGRPGKSRWRCLFCWNRRGYDRYA